MARDAARQLAGYVLAMTVMVVSPYPQEPVGRAPLDLMAVDAVMLTAFSCVAYLVGRTAPLRGVSVPLTAAGVVLSVSPWGDGLLGPLTGLRFTYSGDPVPGGAELGAPPGLVLATHLMEDVHACCDSAIVLCASRKVFLGSPQALREAGGYAGIVAGDAHAGSPR
ncbi:hypothetical protein ACFYMI_34500 [Streptomyces collinus]|uniref:hypothetical protein n=1 Tax=Streptomyces collinus TaxID=42684 RepID=UPI00368F8DEB